MTAAEKSELRTAAKALGVALPDLARDYIRIGLDGGERPTVGEWLFEERPDDRDVLAAAAIESWPTCECAAGGGCSEPATTTDEGVPVCGGCLDGAVWSDDGDSDCECCGAGDRVAWDGSVGYAGAYVYDDAPEEPEEDEDGEWAVIGMDGEEHGRYATEADAQAAIDREAILFSRASVCGSNANAYLPRSVCHVACGAPQRAGQYSTEWYVAGCRHGDEAE